MNIACKFRLLDLPNELISLIIEHVDSPQALRNLAQTCRRLQHLTEPVLYRSMLIRTAGDATDVLDALTSRPERCAGIQQLEIPCNPQYRQDFHAISAILRCSKNLKQLNFESPQCNNGNFEEEEPWSSMTDHFFAPFQAAVQLLQEDRLSRLPLQKLKKLTLHINGCGSPYWTFDRRGISVLLHPTLQYLKMSCVNILDSLEGWIPDGRKTPLKHLVLEECNITHRGLHSILSLPRGLEKLFLGENCNNIRHFPDDVDPRSNHLFSNNAAATLDALSLQKETLKELTYVTTETYYQHRQFARHGLANNRAPVDAGFADFYSLVKVSLAGQCPDFERALMTLRSPPNLRSIEFKAFSPFKRDIDGSVLQDSPLSLVPFLRAPSCSVPETLKSLDVTYESAPLRLEFELSNAAKSLIQAAAKATQNIGVQLKVLYRRYHNYFPPYLYGEPIPREILVFTGHADGFVGRFAPGAPKEPPVTMDDSDDTDWNYTSDESDD